MKGVAMRAIISVSDKTGIVDFARELAKMGTEIISTGGTKRKLEEAGLAVKGVEEITGFPECLDGRVKTLHPAVHGGILARRDIPSHMQKLKELHISPIDIVAINLYPFKKTIMKPDVTLEDAIENIDIGGPAMLRASAKNHKDVVVICDPADYKKVTEELAKSGEVSLETKYRLALKVFRHTAAYDAMIADHLRKQLPNEKKLSSDKTGAELPDDLTLTFEKIQTLRYGENPHQEAFYYREIKPSEGSLVKAQKLHGKELSFNNINDTNGALECLKEFPEEVPAAVAVKHANPCGVATGKTIFEAYRKAHDCDPVSIFGGIVALNRPVDKETALEMNKIFLEIIIAPDFDEDALEILKQKSNVRLLKLPGICEATPAWEIDIKKVSGGILVQSKDRGLFDVKNAPRPDQPASGGKPESQIKDQAADKAGDQTGDKPQGQVKAEGNNRASSAGNLVYDDQLMVATKKSPTEAELRDMEIAMKVVKHTKSNGIVFVKDGKTIAIGPGQTNRIWAVENCIKRCLSDMKGSVMASDAFFPFSDCVEAAAEAGATAIIQPGGSIRDKESIEKADELDISMVFSGMRHFK
ncbi:MAG TPA: bifunctional phosphoribosylaminoimidazolecarboxamide formyltransferase/IMP cyclohydrolase, partial [Bacillota bacterium]|nr:bifunctional phosphoribosylaminoimidazolecarboxamide formyltransferase/IMP cyclohydrolase [Bacillota bacterium]